MQEQYKQWCIKYLEERNVFVAKKTEGDDSIVLEDRDLKTLRKLCDKKDKVDKGFKRISCFEKLCDDKYATAEITSVVGERRWGGGIEVRVTSVDSEHKMEKSRLIVTELVRDTPVNVEKIGRIHKLRDEANQIEKTLDKFTTDEFKKYLIE